MSGRVQRSNLSGEGHGKRKIRAVTATMANQMRAIPGTRHLCWGKLSKKP